MKFKLFLITIFFSMGIFPKDKTFTLLNVSYDPTREFYSEYNKMFSAYWFSKTGDKILFNQSHGGSGKQARAVLDGLEADVLTLALAYDIDITASKGLLSQNWQKSLPNNSAPYTSTIVFVVRKGNPKGIKDWDDLIKSKVQVITANPKTSGGARWCYLAIWAYAEKQFKKDQVKVREFIKTLYKNVPVLDTGARGSSNTFARNGIGDVLLAWENEALLLQKESGNDGIEIVYPPMSILAEPPVAVVEKNTDKHGTTEIAREYLKSLYSEPAQEIIAKHGYRPRSVSALKKFAANFPKMDLVIFESVFGSWEKAQKEHFSDGGSFDKIYVK